MQIQYTNPDDLPENIVSIQGEYIVKDIIANKDNGQGKVFLVAKESQWYAAKIFIRADSLETEVKFMQKVGQCKYVVQLIHFNITGKVTLKEENQTLRDVQFPILIMGFAQHGDMLNILNRFFYIHKTQNHKHYGMPFPIAKTLLYQLLEGLKFIHSKEVFHRDIKLENICLDENFDIKIADFGLASDKNQKNLHFVVGTKGYRGPEVEQMSQFDEKTDIFACGYCFYILCFTSYPFGVAKDNVEYRPFGNPGKSGIRLKKKWESNAKDLQIEAPEEVKQFFSKIFLKKVNERPSINEILESDLMKNRATEEQVRAYLKQQYQECVRKLPIFRKKVTRLRQIYNQLKSLQQNGNMMPETQTNQNTRGILFGQQVHYLSELIKHYEENGINNQKFKKSTNIHQKLATSKPPSLFLAWFELSLQEILIKKNNSILFTLFPNYKLISYDFSLQQNREKIQFELILQPQSTKQQQHEENQQQYPTNPRVQLGLQGEILQRRHDSKYMIRWQKKEGNDFILEFLINQLKEIMQEFIEEEDLRNQQK